MRGTGHWTTGVTVFMFLLAVTFAVMLVRLVLSDVEGTDAGSEIVTAVLALVGGLLATVASGVGVLLKHSMDVRNADLKEQAEKRLNLEAATQAVGLLSTSEGKDVPLTQRAGVLFALANLGMMDLALTMLGQMASTDEIDAATADWLINRGLQSDSQVTRDEACALLEHLALTLLASDDGDYRFPSCLWECNLKLSAAVRLAGITVRLSQLMSRPYSEERAFAVKSAMLMLTTYWWNEVEERLKNGAGICLDRLHSIHQLSTDETFYVTDGEPARIHEAKAAVRGLRMSPIRTYAPIVELSNRLARWRDADASESNGPARA